MDWGTVRRQPRPSRVLTDHGRRLFSRSLSEGVCLGPEDGATAAEYGRIPDPIIRKSGQIFHSADLSGLA